MSISEFLKKSFGKKQEIPKITENIYLEKLEKIKRSAKDSKKKIVMLNNLIKEYLSINYKIKKNESFEDIYQKLKAKKQSELAEFYKKIEYYLYGNTRIKEQDMENLIIKFKSFLKIKKGSEIIDNIILPVIKEKKQAVKQKIPVIKPKLIKKTEIKSQIKPKDTIKGFKTEKIKDNYLNVAQEIKNSALEPEEKLSLVDNLVKTYLRNSFKINKTDDYQKISINLKENKEFELADFCKKIKNYLSSSQIKEQGIENLMTDFISILSTKTENKINKKITPKIIKEKQLTVKIQKIPVIKPKLIKKPQSKIIKKSAIKPKTIPKPKIQNQEKFELPQLPEEEPQLASETKIKSTEPSTRKKPGFFSSFFTKNQAPEGKKEIKLITNF